MQDISSLATQFVSYAFAGAVGTAAQYVLLLTLVTGWDADPVQASALGFLVGFLINYLLSHYWVFRSSKRHSETLFKFLIISAVGLVINTGLMQVAVNWGNIHYFIAQLIATAVVLLWNFAGNRCWTFADKNQGSV